MLDIKHLKPTLNMKWIMKEMEFENGSLEIVIILGT